MSDFAAARADVTALARLGHKARYDAANRVWLLAAHALFGIGLGATFWAIQLPQPWIVAFGLAPHAGHAQAVASVPLVGGALLALGLLLRRNLALECAGMVTMIAWDLVGIWVVRTWYVKVHPGPVQYQVWLYLLPAMLLAIHLATLLAYAWTARRDPDKRPPGPGLLDRCRWWWAGDRTLKVRVVEAQVMGRTPVLVTTTATAIAGVSQLVDLHGSHLISAWGGQVLDMSWAAALIFANGMVWAARLWTDRLEAATLEVAGIILWDLAAVVYVLALVFEGNPWESGYVLTLVAASTTNTAGRAVMLRRRAQHVGRSLP